MAKDLKEKKFDFIKKTLKKAKKEEGKKHESKETKEEEDKEEEDEDEEDGEGGCGKMKKKWANLTKK